MTPTPSNGLPAAGQLPPVDTSGAGAAVQPATATRRTDTRGAQTRSRSWSPAARLTEGLAQWSARRSMNPVEKAEHDAIEAANRNSRKANALVASAIQTMFAHSSTLGGPGNAGTAEELQWLDRCLALYSKIKPDTYKCGVENHAMSLIAKRALDILNRMAFNNDQSVNPDYYVQLILWRSRARVAFRDEATFGYTFDSLNKVDVAWAEKFLSDPRVWDSVAESLRDQVVSAMQNAVRSKDDPQIARHIRDDEFDGKALLPRVNSPGAFDAATQQLTETPIQMPGALRDIMADYLSEQPLNVPTK